MGSGPIEECDTLTPRGVCGEYFNFAAFAIYGFCRGIVLQTTSEYFNLLVNPCQWGRELVSGGVGELGSG